MEQTPTAFMACCSNAKSWWNAEFWLDDRLRPCKHISSELPSPIFICHFVQFLTWLGTHQSNISKPSYYFDTIIRYYDRCHKGKQRVFKFYSPYDTIMSLLWHYYDTIIISIMTSVMTQETIMTLFKLWHYNATIMTIL